jgi:hypothetical protein
MTDAERAARYRKRRPKTVNAMRRKRRHVLRAVNGNKFHAGTNGKHYWHTSLKIFERIYAELGVDVRNWFDPCPHPRPKGFDGLSCDWAPENYVNPPFGSVDHGGRKTGPTAWVRKAIAEWKKGKVVLLVFPLDGWVLELLEAVGARVCNLGKVRWVATEDGSAGPSSSRPIACFLLDPRQS